jgi:hypothetical protein
MVDGQPCTRCGGPLYRSDAVRPRLDPARLELDHDDDRQGYRGLAHARCNRQAGGKAKAMRYRKRKQQPTTTQAQPTRHSRNW